jgi:hypothetical protein
MNYTWDKQGNFTINVKAEDICGLVSPEAKLEIILPRNKMINNKQFLNFFTQQINLFPILKLFFEKLIN